VSAVWIIGASMTRFGRYPEKDVVDLGFDASTAALKDASIGIESVEFIAAGCLFDTNMFGQRVLRQIKQTGIPAYNVASSCATGGSALRVAAMAIRAGEAGIALVVGAEKLGKAGLLGGSAIWDVSSTFHPTGRAGALGPLEGHLGTSLMPGTFAHAGMSYAARWPEFDVTDFARVAVKNHENSARNPLAMYQRAYSLDEVLAAEMIAYPNTILMCCPTVDGAAAAVLASDEKIRCLPAEVRRRAIRIRASALSSDPYTETSEVLPDINEVTRSAARSAYEQAGMGPADLDVVELHDCFATAEVLHYENLGLCAPGEASGWISKRGPWPDGEIPVNMSGGLLSKGHPMGATGIASVYEVVTQLRGEAGARQIEGARIGLTHVVGLGSACVVNILERTRG
jgi:acetyl-CoA acyltransferase